MPRRLSAPAGAIALTPAIEQSPFDRFPPSPLTPMAEAGDHNPNLVPHPKVRPNPPPQPKLNLFEEHHPPTLNRPGHRSIFYFMPAVSNAAKSFPVDAPGRASTVSTRSGVSTGKQKQKKPRDPHLFGGPRGWMAS